MSFFEVKNLTVDYQSLGNPQQVRTSGKVLSDICFNLEQGEILGILGPTGSGKTVLLKTLTGILKADFGEILKNGQNIMSIKPRYRGISLVFQNYALYPHLSAGKNIGFPLLFRRKYRAHPDVRVNEVAKLLHLDEETLLSRKPKHLSGGEKQRVAVGKAIAALPDIILLDEPLSNVDAHLRGLLRHNLRTLIKQNNLTAIYVSHDQRELSFVADRIAVMHGGRILEIGSYDNLYYSPKNFFTALFVGEKTANAFTVEQATKITHGEITQPFVIRPERCSTHPSKSSYLFRGTVEVVERYLEERKILVFVRNSDVRASILLSMNFTVQRGDTLIFYLPKEHIRVFPKD